MLTKEQIKEMARTALQGSVALEEGRPSQQHPIEGHPYHSKSNAELHYIIKDAGAAAKAQKGMSSEGKYLDQQNDASTVLGFRQRATAVKGGSLPDWYVKKYLSKNVKEEVELTESRYGDGGPYGQQVSQDTASAYKEFGTILKGKGYTKSKYSGKQSAQEEHRYEHPNGHTVSFGGWHGTGTGNRDYGGIKMNHYVYDNKAKDNGRHGMVHEFMPGDDHETQHGNGRTTVTKAGYDAHRAHLAKVKSHLMSIGKGVRKEEVEVNEGFKETEASKRSAVASSARAKVLQIMSDRRKNGYYDKHPDDVHNDGGPVADRNFKRQEMGEEVELEEALGIIHTRGSMVTKLEKMNVSDDKKNDKEKAIHHLKQGNAIRAKYYMLKLGVSMKEEVELKEGTLDFSSFAKRQAAENKARMKAEKEKANAGKALSKGIKSPRLAKPIDPHDHKLFKALERDLGGSFEHFESNPKHGHNEHGHAIMHARVTHSYTHEDMGMRKDEMADTAETYNVKVTKHPQHGYQVHHMANSRNLGEEVLGDRMAREQAARNKNLRAHLASLDAPGDDNYDSSKNKEKRAKQYNDFMANSRNLGEEVTKNLKKKVADYNRNKGDQTGREAQKDRMDKTQTWRDADGRDFLGNKVQEEVQVHYHGTDGYGVSNNGKLVKHHDTHESAVAHAKTLSPQIHDMTEDFNYFDPIELQEMGGYEAARKGLLGADKQRQAAKTASSNNAPLNGKLGKRGGTGTRSAKDVTSDEFKDMIRSRIQSR